MRSIRLAVLLVLATTVSLSAQSAPSSPQRRHQPFLHVLTFTVGGIIIGGWAGYLTAQIVKSDWQDPTGRTAQRLRFSVGGATLGLVTGVFLGTRGGRLAAPPGPPRLPLPGGNKPITAQEIRDSAARTLTQLLREMRPQWLRARGTDVLLPGVTNPVAKGGVRVYLNGTLLGGLETLEEVSIDAVTGIRFLNGPEAVLRYGAGDQDGAILLSTQPAP